MRALLILPVLLAATPAFAQDAPPNGMMPDRVPLTADPDKETITIAAAGIYSPDYEGSNDYALYAAPAVIGSTGGFAFQIAGNRASIDLIPNPKGPRWDIQAGPVAVLDLNRSRLSGISDPRVRALGRRDASIELGGYVGIGKTGVLTSPYDKLSISLSYRKGISGAQRGGVLQPTITYLTPLSTKAFAGIVLTAERAERGYGRAYFDVNAAGSLASGLPQFTTRGGWKNYSITFGTGYALTGDLTHGIKLGVGGSYGRMLNDFADSPVVAIAGSKDQWLFAAGLGYTF